MDAPEEVKSISHTEIIAAIQRIDEVLPKNTIEEVIAGAIKTLMGSKLKLFDVGCSVIQSKDFISEQNSIKTLIDIVNSNAEATKESIDGAFQYQKENCSFLEKFWSKYSGCASPEDIQKGLHDGKISDLEKLRKEYIQGIQKLEQEMADTLLKSCIYSTAVTVVLESYKLYIIWSHINDAKNCILDDKKRHKINSNFNTIREGIFNLTSLQMEYETNDDDDDSNHEILDQIEDGITELRDLLGETRNLIGQAQIDIDGKRVQLIADNENLTMSLFSSVSQLAVSAFQLSSGIGAASNLLKFWTGAAIAANVGLIGATVYTKIVTTTVIEESRKEYKCLIDLDNEAAAMQRQLTSINRWTRTITRMIRRRN